MTGVRIEAEDELDSEDDENSSDDDDATLPFVD
jgi:hypothetical protein